MSERSLKFFAIETVEVGAVISPLETVHDFADEEVRNEWDELMQAIDDAGAKNLILDLSRLSFFGSTMLEWIILLGKRVKANEGRMAICNAAPRTLEVLQIARFDTMWPIFPNREEAIDNIRGS